MSVLANSKYEHFAQNVVKGLSATAAYISAGYSRAGAAQSAQRLLRNAKVCSRVQELRETIAARTIALEIADRNARVHALQDRWDRLRRVIEERAGHPEWSGQPGWTTGLLCVDYKGKEADQPVFKVDTGLLSELRNHEKQAAQELGQWNEEGEDPKGQLKFQGSLEDLLALYRGLTAQQ